MENLFAVVRIHAHIQFMRTAQVYKRRGSTFSKYFWNISAHSTDMVIARSSNAPKNLSTSKTVKSGKYSEETVVYTDYISA